MNKDLCVDKIRLDLSANWSRKNRSRGRLFLLIFPLTLFLLSCSITRIRPIAPPVSPIVRVGLVQHADQIRFQPDGSMIITTKKAGERYQSKQTGEWLVKAIRTIDTPQKYRILYMETQDKNKAQNKIKALSPQKVELITKGDELLVNRQKIAGILTFQVLLQQIFNSQQEAQDYLQSSADKDGQIIAVGQSQGELSLISPKGDHLLIRDAVRISGTPFTIKDVQVGEGYHWSHKEDRVYNGELEFRMDDEGKLVAINVLPMEEYLQGVLPGEMSPTFPMEALKAQAIAARTFFLYNFGRVHQHDPFDVCSDVHCQVFVGVKSRDDRIREAVDETRGLVLLHDGELFSTPFSALCGGHTEHVENVWNGDATPVLRGIFDVNNPEKIQRIFDLSNEDNVRKWIESKPEVFCNIELYGNPEFAQYANKYFRWQERFTRTELENNISSYTGTNFGTLLDIVPVSRGVSGRIIELKIVGSARTFTIGKELRIRKALSPQTLYSACFVVDKSEASGNVPDYFVIKGAGWGHGVGMCQIGAALMAFKGIDAAKILRHYYSGTKISQLY